MPNADLKTKVNDASVEKFLNGVPDEVRRRDALAVVKLMKSVTKRKPRMWGSSIIGFDQYHYKYASGREGDMCLLGFSPRRSGLTLYLMMNFKPYAALLKKLGKHKISGSCLHIAKLENVDLSVLRQLIAEAYAAGKVARG